ncbi:MAG TPA: ester cyclase, partial [Gemmataceae bacterium]|nr:ester cyclase [Gemmataceae bacterium]
QEMIADKGRVVATWLWSARHTGDFPGFPATGRPITTSGATVYYFNDRGRITGHWQVADKLGIYQQLRQARGT